MATGLTGARGQTATDRVVVGTSTGSGHAQTLCRCMMGKIAKVKINKLARATQTSVQVTHP